MKRIAVLTSGGDAPGMNAAIRAVVRKSLHHGLDIYGVERGYEGLVHCDFMPLSRSSVSGIISYGGTTIKTARSEAFKTQVGFTRAVRNLADNKIDALIVIGGDGSMAGAQKLNEAGIKTMVIPATIDNDMCGTDYTIGFDTALNTVLEAVNKIRDTSASHERVAIVEVMGRTAGHIALLSGLACGADAVMLPEQPLDIDVLCQQLNESQARGNQYSIVMVAEGAAKSFDLAAQVSEKTSYNPHVTVLGYIQRGGAPSAMDNIMGSRMGALAVDALVAGESGCLVASRKGELLAVPYAEAFAMKRGIDLSLYDLTRILAI